MLIGDGAYEALVKTLSSLESRAKRFTTRTSRVVPTQLLRAAVWEKIAGKETANVPSMISVEDVCCMNDREASSGSSRQNDECILVSL